MTEIYFFSGDDNILVSADLKKKIYPDRASVRIFLILELAMLSRANKHGVNTFSCPPNRRSPIFVFAEHCSNIYLPESVPTHAAQKFISCPATEYERSLVVLGGGGGVGRAQRAAMPQRARAASDGGAAPQLQRRQS